MRLAHPGVAVERRQVLALRGVHPSRAQIGAAQCQGHPGGNLCAWSWRWREVLELVDPLHDLREARWRWKLAAPPCWRCWASSWNGVSLSPRISSSTHWFMRTLRSTVEADSSA